MKKKEIYNCFILENKEIKKYLIIGKTCIWSNIQSKFSEIIEMCEIISEYLKCEIENNILKISYKK